MSERAKRRPMLRIRLTRSPIGNHKRNRATVAALGLRKLNQAVYLPDTPSVRGMILRVAHLLQVESVGPKPEPKAAPEKAPKLKTIAKAAPSEPLAVAPAKPEPKEKRAKPKAAAAKTKGPAKKPVVAKLKAER